MEQFIIQLERLRRHHEAAARSYDHITLLDLSHSLRVWADLKPQVVAEFPDLTKTAKFQSGTPTAAFKKLLKGTGYVIAYMPGGVRTYAKIGELINFEAEGNKSRTYFCQHMRQDDFHEIMSYGVIEADLSTYKVSHPHVERLGFEKWLGSEALRISERGPDGAFSLISISRETFVRRMANGFGASHPVGMEPVTENKIDPLLEHLMTFKVLGLPLPYVVLIKISQDILRVLPYFIKSPA